MKLSIRFLIVLTSIIILGILTSLYFSSTNFPIIYTSDLSPVLVLINQNGEEIIAKDYRDKIYVTNFIFTRCVSILPSGEGFNFHPCYLCSKRNYTKLLQQNLIISS